MLKIAILLAPAFLLCSSVLGQESLHILTLRHHDSPIMAPIQTIGVSVDQEKLTEVSNSILMAEKWLKTYFLSYYPSTTINSIVVANNLLCNYENLRNQQEIVRLTLDSMKNIYYSLTRWGLEREIKISVSLSMNCVHQSHLKPVRDFLEEINSTYTVISPQFSDEIDELLKSELKLMNDLGIFQSDMVNVISPVSKQPKFTSRKLSFIDRLWSTASPPAPVVNFSPPPEIQPPVMAPASSPSPHYGFNLPPCNPYPQWYHSAPPLVVVGGSLAAPPPMVGGQERLWCVAKPSVPSEKLQVAMDYACGAGGADCGPIQPNGSCYSPDSVVAHASYAFNSYWQKNKKNGGICQFQGTAMLITSDPSFLQCHFTIG